MAPAVIAGLIVVGLLFALAGLTADCDLDRPGEDY